MREQVEAGVASVRRLGGWWVAAALALLVVAVIANQQLSVLLYKALQVALGVVLAYVADRSLFRYAPEIGPTLPQDVFGAARLLARAIVVLAVLAGFAIGI